MRGVIDLGEIPLDRLTWAIENGAQHMRPIYRAVRDRGCSYLIVTQHAEHFDMPPGDRPMISIVGDDMLEALGPTVFPRKALRRLFKAADAAVVVSSAPVVHVYAAAADRAAERRQNIVIVETLPDFELQWLEFIDRIRGAHFPILLCTVRAEDIPLAKRGSVH